MNNDTLKVAVIGCGRVSGHHLRSIAQVEGGEIVAVCDLVEEKAKAYGEEYGILYFVNYHTMLTELPDIDAVAIVTPSGMHYEHAFEILEGYGKHLIVEKPTFMRPEQVTKAYALARKLGVEIFPVFQNRYNRAVRRVKQAIDSSELGAIRIIAVRVRWCRPQRYYDLAPWRGTFSHDGGALTNQGIHHVDLLRYLGGNMSTIKATMRTLGANIEVEDTVVATLEYTSDAVGVVEVTTAARPDDFEASLSLVCENGLVQLGGLAVNELQIFTPDPSACSEYSQEIPDAYGFGHIDMYRDIVDHLRGVKAYPVDEQDCMDTIKLLHGFYRSDEIGTMVEFESGEQSDRLGRDSEDISNLYRTSKCTNNAG